ncbi:MAG TPA: hypothetical protein VKE40_03700 [Gemmataceae bacterium]|nr:hypothetical protein [Gemmataceae bacterium]
MSAVTIDLPAETERKLREKASSVGLSLETYLRRLAEHAANGQVARPGTFDEILAPVRDGFAASGAGEEELTRDLKEARDEAWRERQARAART